MDAADVEPIAHCPDCGHEIPTAWELCASCQHKHDEHEIHADDPRRG